VKLLDFIKEIEKNIPVWDNVLIYENYLENYSVSIKKSDLINLIDYEEKFDKLISAGYSWLNFQCLGIYQKKLIIVIEIPRDFSDERVKTNVNYSGPFISSETGKLSWDFDFSG